jgi:S-formylglutathione hydrolase FrmB
MKFKIYFLSAFLLIGMTFSVSCQNSKVDVDLKVTLDPSLLNDFNENGRLFFFITQNPNVEPRTQTWPSPFAKTHIFAKNLQGANAARFIEVENFDGWLKTSSWSLDDFPAGDYYVQVLWDQDNKESRINAPGNLFSEKEMFSLSGDKEIQLELSQKIDQVTIVDHPLVKEINFKSALLSEWWNKPMYLKATVLLPNNYQKGKAYPIRYNVAGYGGRYYRINNLVKSDRFMPWWESEEAPSVITVFLDGEGPFGDSYQMDSENSGPYGQSLIEELIPYIEKEYRGTTASENRFVDGCSTGGWVSLGLQLYYPDVFDGVFSYSPDAIDFENYQLINIYTDQNAFVNEFGYNRPVMRNTDGEPLLSLKEFIQYENVLGPSDSYLTSGGQFSAHTALYSPKGSNGLPEPLFDPVSGAINEEVATHWKKYDFKNYATDNWSELGPKVQGKIFIWMGDMDHFYLNMATRTFADFLSSTTAPKSDAIVEFTPMSGHCTEFNHRDVLEKIATKLR